MTLITKFSFPCHQVINTTQNIAYGTALDSLRYAVLTALNHSRTPNASQVESVLFYRAVIGHSHFLLAGTRHRTLLPSSYIARNVVHCY